jgi:hypothetical protein
VTLSDVRALTSECQAIENAETSLDNHLKEIRQEIKMSSLQFVTVAGIDVRLRNSVVAEVLTDRHNYSI